MCFFSILIMVSGGCDMNGLESKYSNHLEIWIFAWWHILVPQEQRAQQSLAKLIVRQVWRIARGWFKHWKNMVFFCEVWCFLTFAVERAEENNGKPVRTGILFDPPRRFFHFFGYEFQSRKTCQNVVCRRRWVFEVSPNSIKFSNLGILRYPKLSGSTILTIPCWGRPQSWWGFKHHGVPSCHIFWCRPWMSSWANLTCRCCDPARSLRSLGFPWDFHGISVGISWVYLHVFNYFQIYHVDIMDSLRSLWVNMTAWYYLWRCIFQWRFTNILQWL